MKTKSSILIYFKILLLVFTLIHIGSGCISKPNSTVIPTEKNKELVEKVVNVDSISLETKIAEMIMVGFRGFDLDSSSIMYNNIKEYKVGGVILFDQDALTHSERNIQSPMQLQKLTTKLQNLSPFPLFIGMDQEGGRIVRLKPEKGFQSSRRAEDIGALNDLDSTVSYAIKMSKELKDLGVNMNFAPCVDVNVNPYNPIIAKYWRSFSSSAEIVTNHARIFASQMRKEAVISVLKHFPGHGSSREDSHFGLPDISDTWVSKEWTPYKCLFKEDLAPVVMIAHVMNLRFK